MCDPWVQTPCFDLRHLRPRPTRWSGQKSTSPVTDAQIIAPTNGSATPILDTARTDAQIIAPTNGSATPILDTARKRAQIGAATNGSATPILDTARTNAHSVAPTTGSTPVVVSTSGGRSGHWDERGGQDSTGSHG
jgi:chorismate-pyruvate lyase